MIRPRPDSVAVAALLTMLVAFGPISTDMYLPSLPALVSDFDSDSEPDETRVFWKPPLSSLRRDGCLRLRSLPEIRFT